MEEIVFGYGRVSTPKQNLERQIENICKAYPSADLHKEKYTGTTRDRPVWLGLNRKIELIYEQCQKTGKPMKVTIVFDSVSRMSRNADEGVADYERLYDMGVELVFLKEPYINTANVREQISKAQLERKGDDVDVLLEAIEKYLIRLAKKQVRLAFEQSEKEVKDLQQRTKEGIKQAKDKGKHIGGFEGRKLTVKKAAPAKEIIKKYAKAFNPESQMTDVEVMTLAHISKNTYYKYRAELLAEINSGDGASVQSV